MKKPAFPESRFGGTADGEVVKQAARQSRSSTKKRPLAASRCLARIDRAGTRSRSATGELVVFYKTGRDVTTVRQRKNGVPTPIHEVRTPSARRESNRGRAGQPTLARAGTFLLEAAASTNASINCMSSEMFPSFSGCHCTPVTHQE